MKREILGPITIIGVTVVGGLPGPKNFLVRFLTGCFMLATIIGQFFDALEDGRYTMGAMMEALAVAITTVLSFVKYSVLWIKRKHVEESLDMLEEDWKKEHEEKYLEIMSRNAKLARNLSAALLSSYYGTVIAFAIRTILGYTREDPDNYFERELIFKVKYPFDVFHSPIYEFVNVLGMVQGVLLCTGNQVADSILFLLTIHVNGQLDILYDRILRFSDVRQLPEIIRQHQRIIHFAELIETTFKWIGLVEFLLTSLIICSIGYVLINTLESDIDQFMIMKLCIYMFVMQLGTFIYCHTGDVLSEKCLNIRQAAYESNWSDLPPEMSKVLITIMMRADKPIFLTAGGFCNLNYESFVNISKTAASYLSVIRASSE